MTEQQLAEFELAFKQFVIEQGYADTAHDLAHVERVVKTARQLAVQEGAPLAVVLPAAWLHDCVSVPKNSPLRAKASTLAADQAITLLTRLGYPQAYYADIHHAIVAHSFSARVVCQSLAAKVVQDADRLDALGAIGVARCFTVGGMMGRHLYHPGDPFCAQRPAEDVLYTLDHFFEKLLGIEHSLNTDAARQQARQRIAFMMTFMSQLANEIGVEIQDLPIKK